MTHDLHRFYGAGDLHFVTFSCYQRSPLLQDPIRRDIFLQALEHTRRHYRLVVLGYVVMPEHVHLLLSEPQRENLSTAIQALKLSFVRRLQGIDDSSVAGMPRSGKIGETWGTQRHELQAAAFGKPAFTTSMFGRNRNASRNCATSTATR